LIDDKSRVIQTFYSRSAVLRVEYLIGGVPAEIAEIRRLRDDQIVYVRDGGHCFLQNLRAALIPDLVNNRSHLSESMDD